MGKIIISLGLQQFTYLLEPNYPKSINLSNQINPKNLFTIIIVPNGFTTELKLKWKNILCVYFIFQAILSMLLTNLLRVWKRWFIFRPHPIWAIPRFLKIFLKVSLLGKISGNLGIVQTGWGLNINQLFPPS